jgi:hypothetical protein
VNFAIKSHIMQKDLIASLVFWDRLAESEAVASSCASASCYRHSEDVGVVAIVVLELAFRDVERQIFCADLVVAADNRPLEDRPEAFNRVCVNGADDIFADLMLHGLMRVVAHSFERKAFIRRQQADLAGNRFADESLNLGFADALQHADDDVALALDRADHCDLAGALAAGLAMMLLVPMTVGVFAANPGIVGFHNPHQLAKFFVLQCRADAMADIPCGLVRAEAHVPLDLQGADALLSTQHQVDDLEPVAQVDFCVLENGPDQVREAISATLAAVRAFPLKFHGGQRINVRRAAAWAMNALGPAICDQIVVASLLIGEKLVELGGRQLVGFLSHFRLSDCEARIA